MQEEEPAFARRGLDDTSRSLLDQSVALRQSAEPIINEAIEQVLSLAGEEGAKAALQILAIPTALGLGDLLQRIDETGWQLSHGEQSRSKSQLSLKKNS